MEIQFLAKKRHDNLHSVTEKNQTNVMIICSIGKKRQQFFLELKNEVQQYNIFFWDGYKTFQLKERLARRQPNWCFYRANKGTRRRRSALCPEIHLCGSKKYTSFWCFNVEKNSQINCQWTPNQVPKRQGKGFSESGNCKNGTTRAMKLHTEFQL